MYCFWHDVVQVSSCRVGWHCSGAARDRYWCKKPMFMTAATNGLQNKVVDSNETPYVLNSGLIPAEIFIEITMQLCVQQ